MSMETKFFELEKKLFPRLPEISSKVDATAYLQFRTHNEPLTFLCVAIFSQPKNAITK